MKPHGRRNHGTLLRSSIRRTATARSPPTPPWSAGTPAPPDEQSRDSGRRAGRGEEDAGGDERMRTELHPDVEGGEEVVQRAGELVACHFEVELERVDP